MIQRKRWLFTVTVACIVILTTSCTNMTAVREWSKTSLQATQYNEIITTYSNTPQRLKRYDPSGPWDSQIELREKQAEALRKILSVISDYMAALAILSADSTIDYNKDVDTLTSSIGSLDAGISSDTLGAIGSLVKAVLGAAAKAYQAKQVANIVEQANAPLQNILKGELRQIIAKDFQRDLEIEKTSLDRYYGSHLDTGSPSSAAKAALVEWKELRLEQNAKRLKAIKAYLTVLDKVAEGHKELYDKRNDLDAEALVKELYSLVKEIRKQIKVLANS